MKPPKWDDLTIGYGRRVFQVTAFRRQSRAFGQRTPRDQGM
ncbi:MAG: hypothetical protein WAM70_09810 [Pyrinomonadaceae bacterium]